MNFDHVVNYLLQFIRQRYKPYFATDVKYI